MSFGPFPLFLVLWSVPTLYYIFVECCMFKGISKTFLLVRPPWCTWILWSIAFYQMILVSWIYWRQWFFVTNLNMAIQPGDSWPYACNDRKRPEVIIGNIMLLWWWGSFSSVLTFSLGPAPGPGHVMLLGYVSVCLFVCVCLSVCPPIRNLKLTHNSKFTYDSKVTHNSYWMMYVSRWR